MATKTTKLRPEKAAIMACDKKHILGRWEVVGPVTQQEMQYGTGKRVGLTVGLGYGIRAVEPEMFGGTEVYKHGLFKAVAEKMVKAHNDAIKGGR